MKLNRIDINILSELQKHGRMTNIELAERVHLSASPCLARTKKLQEEGYIVGYSAQIDLARLGQVTTIFTEVTLKSHLHVDFSRFVVALNKVENVVECHRMTGGYDFLIKFATRDISEYQEIMERLTNMDVGIDKYFGYVVMNSPITRHHLPLARLFGDAT
jgi:DNA-binding Lrp family transcriptional regulator